MAQEPSRDDGERTENASAKRQREAREQGRAPLSREVAPLAAAASCLALLATITPDAVRHLAVVMAQLLARAHETTPSGGLRALGAAALWVAGPIAVAAGLATSLAVLGQTGFLIRLGAAAPDPGRINPLAGLARLLGPHNLMEAGKSLLKVALVGWARSEERR